MVKIKSYIVLLLFLTLVQCKTVKTVTDTKATAIEKRDVTQIIQKKTTDSSAFFTADKSILRDSVYENVAEYILSDPDSLGKQFVKLVRTTQKGSDKIIANDIQSIIYTNTESNNSNKLIDNTKTELSNKNSEVKKEYNSVFKTYEIITLAVVFLTLIVLFIIKKFKK